MPSLEPSVITISARQGKATFLHHGQNIKVINTYGQQVIDTWTFNREDLHEYMSMEYTRSLLERITPLVGDSLVTTRRRPILTLIEDHSPGAHDTLIAACTRWGYRAQGYTDYHENCTDNLSNALGKLGLSVAMTPCPLNLFMNVPVTAEGVLTFQPPLCSKGDYVVFRAEMDCVVVFSACPQEKLPVNGVDGRPTDAHFQIY
ncbi:MAG: urea carboxylase-associated family protein [Proteobacteria bacterium]|nr:MAG: urea carboxylase-associated family protein [Pseudomonadota bacterium]TDJ68864.1 MAG: urea carboxylase-associated family protein [Pseudomonadota bacterium]